MTDKIHFNIFFRMLIKMRLWFARLCLHSMELCLCVSTAWKKYDGQSVVEEDKRRRDEHVKRISLC